MTVLNVVLHSGSFCSDESLNLLFVFISGLAVGFAQEKTDSVSLTVFVFFRELFHLAKQRVSAQNSF